MYNPLRNCLEVSRREFNELHEDRKKKEELEKEMAKLKQKMNDEKLDLREMSQLRRENASLKKKLSEQKNEITNFDKLVSQLKEEKTEVDKLVTKLIEERIDLNKLIDKSNSIYSKTKVKLQLLEESSLIFAKEGKQNQAPIDRHIEEQKDFIDDGGNIQSEEKEQTEKEIQDPASLQCIPCDICSEDDTTKASHHYCIDCNEFMCSECKRVHEKSKATKHHTILSGDQMPKKQIANGENRICSKHDDELLKFRCKDHEVFLCAVCVTLEHKGCTFEYIKDIGEKFPTSKEYLELLSEINNLAAVATLKESECLSKKLGFETYYDQLQNEVTAFRASMGKKIEEIEKALLNQTKIWSTVCMKGSDIGVQTFQSISNELNEMLESLKDLEYYKQNQQLVITASKFKMKIQTVEKQINQTDSAVADIEQLSSDNGNEMKDMLNLGDKLVKSKDEEKCQGNNENDHQETQKEIIKELEESGQENV